MKLTKVAAELSFWAKGARIGSTVIRLAFSLLVTLTLRARSC